ncbi:Ribosomal RNA small subunit methyltransferase F [Tepidimonas alkaliphilus]|uniref:Ribosomal RNA small subunit methyltransferase F n=1 Tax=Tepidimonas alkaliphilus TaxID=2588942 RepID=A0A554WAC5_9BURK|nr:RsmB/NOP family class I SAM-dependent RNA methyltransferase [Tepidimonas alkaliphilus]TSE20526.1 Ribosomal RNA small subunit methyltransferase F [Tepidimonas alkaliphilus]
MDRQDPDALPPLPAAFAALLDAVIPPEHRAMVEASYAEPKDAVVRHNPLQGVSLAHAAEALAALGAEPLPGVEGVWRVPAAARERLTRHPLVEQGALYIQGAASQAAVWALDPQPGEDILDLAAAPGGKTALIAARLANRGRIAAVEPVRARFFRLKANLQRLGVTCAQLYLKDGTQVGRLVPQRFDRVLLDAPCSSEAQFTRLDPASWAHWSPRKVRASAALQARLLRSAVQALKPGGVLLYSTCSLSPQEDELVLDALLRERDDLTVEPLPWPCPLPAAPGLAAWDGQPLHPDLQRARRVLPSRWTDAFFLARLRKAG